MLSNARASAPNASASAFLQLLADNKLEDETVEIELETNPEFDDAGELEFEPGMSPDDVNNTIGDFFERFMPRRALRRRVSVKERAASSRSKNRIAWSISMPSSTRRSTASKKRASCSLTKLTKPSAAIRKSAAMSPAKGCSAICSRSLKELGGNDSLRSGAN